MLFITRATRSVMFFLICTKRKFFKIYTQKNQGKMTKSFVFCHSERFNKSYGMVFFLFLLCLLNVHELRPVVSRTTVYSIPSIVVFNGVPGLIFWYVLSPNWISASHNISLVSFTPTASKPGTIG